ncbi:MarR family transcriptional regulator [Streptacidiphilus sp. PB12-B1b]|uniref:MarR family winged helix-turn-helix transcriptional regulator n=1 Tax=Streptacidiphilus sp. PB12-B1b TaxID=2705012 RepID=UPI0015FE612E|nr:MarR family transcriptional regulator [Streptacidiphilus sp. PB12-B1b]QMU75464.1 MarR family transcriptional regulator [Streptacidiphilus sp. PB12-B1b]
MSSTTPAPQAPTKADLIEEFAALGAAYFQDFAAVAARHGLTSVQAKALAVLVRTPVPMRGLADALVCDASNVTGLVDRLEVRGLVRREVSAVDRRIKIVVATEAGADAIRAVRDDMQTTHEALDLLDDQERTVLYDLLTRLRPVLEQSG